MKSKKILIIILILLVISIALIWFITSRLNQEQVLQSSSYVEMFGTVSMGESIVHNEVRRNMRFDIIEVTENNNGINVARANVIMPDLAKSFRAVHENYNIRNMTTEEVDEKMVIYLQNNFKTVQREFEVIRQNGEWQISDNSIINDLFEEQASSLLYEMLRTMEFEPFTGDEIRQVPHITPTPPNRR